VFAQVLGELEQISTRLDPGLFDGRRAAELFDDAARAERLCTAIKVAFSAPGRGNQGVARERAPQRGVLGG
jgi:hypothetical protein